MIRRPEMLRVIGTSRIPSSCSRLLKEQTAWTVQAVIGAIWPEFSAKGMNSDGGIQPPRPSGRRIRASKLSTRPVDMRTTGW